MNPGARLAIYRWLAERGTEGLAGEVLLAGFCERLVAGGVPVTRSMVTIQSLDPVVGALGFRWQRTRDAPWRESYVRLDDPNANLGGWRASPFYALWSGTDHVLRQRLDRPGAEDAFPIFKTLKAEGATEYIAVKQTFGGRGAGAGVLSSWVTDRPGGFTDAQVDGLFDLLIGLGLAIRAEALAHGFDTVLKTYLGRATADRVLDGSVERGVAHTLDAVLWASDLAGFTRLTDSVPRERVIGLLNAYAERTVDAIEAAGGEVLKFTGDGLLAVFDRAALADAPARALAAAVRALAEADALGRERDAAGLPASRLRVALHCGEVFYGNVGSRARLDFTVVGPAVNEAVRLCDMCKSVDRPLVVSSAFFDCAEADRDRLVGLGRYALRGVGRPQHLYTVDPDA